MLLFAIKNMGKLSNDQEIAFKNIGWAIGDGYWHLSSDIKGAGIPKKYIPRWMAFFEKEGLYKSRKSAGKKEYIITDKGSLLFSGIKDKDHRAAQPIGFQYPEGIKASKSRSSSKR